MQKEFEGLCEYKNLEWLRNTNSMTSTTDVKESNSKSTKPMNNNSHLYGDAIGYVNYSLSDDFKRLIFEDYIEYAYHSSNIIKRLKNNLKTKLDSCIIATIAYHKVTNCECAKLTANDWIERFDLEVTKQAFAKSWLPLIHECESYITIALMEADMHCDEYRKIMRDHAYNT